MTTVAPCRRDFNLMHCKWVIKQSNALICQNMKSTWSACRYCWPNKILFEAREFIHCPVKLRNQILFLSMVDCNLFKKQMTTKNDWFDTADGSFSQPKIFSGGVIFRPRAAECWVPSLTQLLLLLLLLSSSWTAPHALPSQTRAWIAIATQPRRWYSALVYLGLFLRVADVRPPLSCVCALWTYAHDGSEYLRVVANRDHRDVTGRTTAREDAEFYVESHDACSALLRWDDQVSPEHHYDNDNYTQHLRTQGSPLRCQRGIERNRYVSPLQETQNTWQVDGPQVSIKKLSFFSFNNKISPNFRCLFNSASNSVFRCRAKIELIQHCKAFLNCLTRKKRQ